MLILLYLGDLLNKENIQRLIILENIDKLRVDIF